MVIDVPTGLIDLFLSPPTGVRHSLVAGVMLGVFSVVVVLLGLSRQTRAEIRELEGRRDKERQRYVRLDKLRARQRILRPFVILSVAIGAIATIAIGVAILRAPEIEAPPPVAQAGAEASSSPNKAEILASETRAGWGPQRNTVDPAARSDRISFNSMTDHPVYGDERNFMRIRPAGEPDADFSDYLIVTPGENYEALIYISNNARPSPENIAEDVRVQVVAPATFEGSGRITGSISSSNASPERVWDSAVVVLRDPSHVAAIRYVPGSAALYSNSERIPLQNELYLHDGTQIGCGDLNGTLPPVDDCPAYVSFEFRVDQPDFTLATKARVKDTGEDWSYGVLEVRTQDILEVEIAYANAGSVTQSEVAIKLGKLPLELSYIQGSAEIGKAGQWEPYEPASHDPAEGLMLGSQDPEDEASVRLAFRVDVSSASGSGAAKWINVEDFAIAETPNGDKSSDFTFILLP